MSVNVTAVGSYIGTPDYMAPEQISGRSVDGRTDQYSLACVAFQLLTGAVPFQRDQLPAVIYAHLSEPPPSLVSRRPDLPAVVDQVVAKAMAKTAEKRYESCGDFADALREALGVTSYHRRSSASAPPSLPPHPPPDASPDALVDRTIDSGPDSWPPGAGQTPEVAVPGQPGPPDPRSASAPGDLPPSGTSPSEIPPPTAPKAAAVAGNGLPAAAAAAAVEHHLAGDLETTVGSRESAGDLGRLTDPGSGGDGTQPAQRPPRRRGPVTSWILRHRLPVFALTCAALAAAVTIPLVSSGLPGFSPWSLASSGPVAADTGRVSLGNLSQSPSPVDVYLYSSDESSPRLVQHDVAYGTILPGIRR